MKLLPPQQYEFEHIELVELTNHIFSIYKWSDLHVKKQKNTVEVEYIDSKACKRKIIESEEKKKV